MFRTAELGRCVSKKEFHEAAPPLRAELLEVQQQLRSAPFPVIIVFGGVDKAGKSETINLLNEWMDPRWLLTRAYATPSDEMIERPEFWRYWRDLPPRGRIGLFLSCWYSAPLLDHVQARTDEAQFDEALDRVIRFERSLADDGALILKFWLHLGKDAQKKRLTSLEKDPLTRWRVSETDWKNWKMFDRFIMAAERVIMRTSKGHAPWHIVEGFDKRYRSLSVGFTVLESIKKHLKYQEVKSKIASIDLDNAESSRPSEETPSPDEDVLKAASSKIGSITILSALDLSKQIDKDEYGRTLEKHQGQLNALFRDAKARGISTITVFEGWDAAGKGGAIRRVTAALDARDFQVIPIAAPTDEERAHHYLWRFWRHLSRAGRLTIFDRSWYGRVLVERVEGFATESDWRRAYGEINDFEGQMIDHGIVLCKFWLHISKEEQLLRFQERGETPYKRWKLTDEDWRNRERWDLYEAAVNDMIERTSTTVAPWTLIEANDKRFARVKVLKTICERLAARLEIAEQEEKSAAEPKEKASKKK